MRTSSKVLAVVATAGLAVVVGVLGGAAVAGGQKEPRAPSANSLDAVPHVYERNDSGMTFGSLSDATSLGNEPDLVAVVMPDGSDGYVLRDELDRVTGAHISTLEEAFAWEESLDELDTTLTAYDREGNVIGTWDGVNSQVFEGVDAERRFNQPTSGD